MSLLLNAGDADILSTSVGAMNDDAVITCTDLPIHPASSENLLSIFNGIQYRNLNTTIDDDIRFRMSVAMYNAAVEYLDDLFTPSWANTNAQTVDNTNDAVIKAVKDGDGTDYADNSMTLTISQDSSRHTVSGPGNFVSNVLSTTHGCLADLHVSYVAASLTNAHEGKAIILNENDIFDTLATNNGGSTFGALFMQSLFPLPQNTSTNDGYYTQDAGTGLLNELLGHLYHGDPSRFSTSADVFSGEDGMNDNDTEEFQMIPLKAADTISIKLIITANIRMSAAQLGTTNEAGAKSVMANITNVCNANPATYENAVNQAGTGRLAGAHDNITVSGTIGQAGSYVSVPLRDQTYMLTFQLPSLPPASYDIYEIANSNYSFGPISGVEYHQFNFGSAEIASYVKTTAISDGKWLYFSEFDTTATDAELVTPITNAQAPNPALGPGPPPEERAGYGSGGIIHFYAIDPTDWVLNGHWLRIHETDVKWFRHWHGNTSNPASLNNTPPSIDGARKLILAGEIAH